MNKEILLETAEKVLRSFNGEICASFYCNSCPLSSVNNETGKLCNSNKKLLESYIKENEPKEEIMELNKIDKSKCQWAWVGDTQEEVRCKERKRLVVAMMPSGSIIAVSDDNADRFLNDTFMGVTSWKFYELFKEPKTKTIPMTFEDVLCIPCENDCVVVFRDKINNKMYLNITINEKCESFCGRSEYSIFNKSTKTYGEWLPLTKTIEVEE